MDVQQMLNDAPHALPRSPVKSSIPIAINHIGIDPILCHEMIDHLDLTGPCCMHETVDSIRTSPALAKEYVEYLDLTSNCCPLHRTGLIGTPNVHISTVNINQMPHGVHATMPHGPDKSRRVVALPSHDCIRVHPILCHQMINHRILTSTDCLEQAIIANDRTKLPVEHINKLDMSRKGGQARRLVDGL